MDKKQAEFNSVPQVITGGLAIDDRGTLKFINDFDPVKYGIRRFYQVENFQQGFIRAWHGHQREAKYVYVASGAALVGCFPVKDATLSAIDITTHKFTLSESISRVLYIPPGWFNGFKSLSPDTKILFFSTSTLEESKGDDIRLDHDFIKDFWKEDYR